MLERGQGVTRVQEGTHRILLGLLNFTPTDMGHWDKLEQGSELNVHFKTVTLVDSEEMG